MSNIIQCKLCLKPFQSTGGKVCGSCLTQADEDFVTIRDYLYDHPGNISIEELSEKTEVAENMILFLMREGRLEINSHASSGAAHLCELCRRPISEGTMCADCRNKLASTLSRSVPKPSAAQSGERKPFLPDRGANRMHGGSGRR